MLLNKYIKDEKKNLDLYLAKIFKNVLELKTMCINRSKALKMVINDPSISNSARKLKDEKKAEYYDDLALKCDILINNWDNENIHNNAVLITDDGFIIDEDFDKAIQEGLIKLDLLKEDKNIKVGKYLNKNFVPIVCAASLLGGITGYGINNAISKHNMINDGMNIVVNEIKEKTELEYPTVNYNNKVFIDNNYVSLKEGLEKYQRMYNNAGLSNEEGAIYLIDFGINENSVLSAFDTDEESVDSYALSKYYESKYKEENNKSLKLTK